MSRWTINRECAKGTIPCLTTPGGHRRIDPEWVAQTYPALRIEEEDAM